MVFPASPLAPRTIQYPPPSVVAAIPTTGNTANWLTPEPAHAAAPHANIPASPPQPTERPRPPPPTKPPLREDAAPTPTAAFLKGPHPAEPANAASPKANIPPSEAATQYPRPSGVRAMPTTG